MEPRTLKNSSAVSAVNYIIQGYYNKTPINLPEDESNLVFELVNNKRKNLSEGKRKEVDEVLNRMRNVSVMKFSCSTDYETDILLVRDKNIQSLALGIVKKKEESETDDGPPRKKPKKQNAEGEVDIVSLLRNNLTHEAQQNLIELDILQKSYERASFKRGWVQPLAQLLPSLRILNIANQHIGFNDLTNDFGDLCDSMPNLVSLNVNKILLVNMKGISRLVCLEDLTIGFVLWTDEIYDLKKLKKLHFGDEELYNGPMKEFIKSDKSLLSLEVLHCSDQLRLNNEQLKRIERRHPKLKRIIATNTDLKNYTTDKKDIVFIIDDTITNCVQAIEYYESQLHHEQIRRILLKIHDHLSNAVEADELEMLNRKLHQWIPKYEEDSDIMKYSQYCCGSLIRNHLQLLDEDNKHILIVNFLKTVKEPGYFETSWDRIKEVLNNTQNPQADLIVSTALKIFLSTNEKLWRYKLMELIDLLLEKVNIQSDFFEGMDKQKLLCGLKKFLPCSKRKIRYTEEFHKTLNKIIEMLSSTF
ncbi:hypothetical protein CAEBREN_13295 [Caenorhabditis brenneri]|uniref:Uncharacterized protein n=1 Tax=Caenorhabditis brenneri TaxID=135651 RepID=G0N514_CAEBE|nr:hypothetical protein CAEBREN_13295 [Caenorhabditis brenneri]